MQLAPEAQVALINGLISLAAAVVAGTLAYLKGLHTPVPTKHPKAPK